jgi:hypothetical protein
MGDHRVIIFTRDVRLSQSGGAGVKFAAHYVYVESGYEAAAEILAEPALALVIDLSCLTPPHRKLLRVAREAGVEVFGVGSLPAGMSAEDLSGVRLISTGDLPDLLARTAESPAARRPAQPTVRLAPAKAAEFQPEHSTKNVPAERPAENGRQI